MGIGVKPLGNRVIVKPMEKEEQVTSGGIIIPDTAKEKPTKGTVIAVGPGARGKDGSIIPMAVKEGDKIIFGKWGGNEIKIEGEEYLLMKEDDIYGIIE